MTRTAHHSSPTTILRMPEVVSRVGLSRSQVYAMINRGEFPKQIRLSARTSGWIEADIENWIESRRIA